MSWLIVRGMRRVGFVSVLGKFCFSLGERGGGGLWWEKIERRRGERVSG
jgi:hypothetical protein